MAPTASHRLHATTLFFALTTLLVLSPQSSNALSYTGSPAPLTARRLSPHLAVRMVKHHHQKRDLYKRVPATTDGATGATTPGGSQTTTTQDPLGSAISDALGGGGAGNGKPTDTTTTDTHTTTTSATTTASTTSNTSQTSQSSTSQSSQTSVASQTTPAPDVNTPTNTNTNTNTNTSNSRAAAGGPSTITQTSTNTAPASSQSTSPDAPVLPQSAVIALIVIGASIGGAIALWTIIRKWKFSPSKQFEERLEPIDWQPGTAGATAGTGAALDPLDRQMMERANSTASRRASGASFAGGSSQDHSQYMHNTSFGPDEHLNAAPTMPAMLDYNAAPYTGAEHSGYADVQRGPSPPQGYARGPYDYDPATAAGDAYGGYEQYPDYAAGVHQGHPDGYAHDPYADAYAVNPAMQQHQQPRY